MASMIETAANSNEDAVETEAMAAFSRALDDRLGAGATFAAREAAGLELANADGETVTIFFTFVSSRASPIEPMTIFSGFVRSPETAT